METRNLSGKMLSLLRSNRNVNKETNKQRKQRKNSIKSI